MSRSSSDGLDPMGIFLVEIAKIPLLSREQEREVVAAAAAGDREAKAELSRRNLKLVVGIAKRFRGFGLDMEDLVGEGCLGLLAAAEKFDPARAGRFSTLATKLVEQFILRAIHNKGKLIRLPMYAVDQTRIWARTKARLEEQLGRTPQRAEIADAMGIRQSCRKTLYRAVAVREATIHRDQEGSDGSLLDEFRDESIEAAELIAQRREQEVLLGRCMAELDPRHSEVLRLRLGADGDPLSLAKIGQRLGVSKARVGQMERDAIHQIRELVASA